MKHKKNKTVHKTFELEVFEGRPLQNRSKHTGSRRVGEGGGWNKGLHPPQNKGGWRAMRGGGSEGFESDTIPTARYLVGFFFSSSNFGCKDKCLSKEIRDADAEAKPWHGLFCRN